MDTYDTDNVHSSDNVAIIDPDNAPNVQREESIPASYGQVKAALIKSHPEALTMDELNRLTGIKQAEIFMATNYGLEAGEMLRDATYHPARYTVNPEKVDMTMKESKSANVQAAVHQPAKRTRQPGLFKDIVTYLIKTREHLTVDEIMFRAGIQSNIQTVRAALSAQYAKKAISRESWSTPHKYFIDEKLKAEYIKKFDIQLDEGSMDKGNKQDAAPEKGEGQDMPVRTLRRKSSGPKPIVRKGRQQIGERAALVSAPKAAAPVAVVEKVTPKTGNQVNAEPQTVGFDASLTLDGMLTLIIDGKSTRLSSDETRKLARLIKSAAD